MKQTIMKGHKAALDTNVLIYLYDSSNSGKRNIALDLLSEKPQIPGQVISECLNTLRRLLPMTKEDLLIHAANLFGGCNIIPILPTTLSSASLLIKQYQFQLFDAVIVASAIQGGCDVLYSEDMQHQLSVNKSLRIINPFI